MSRLGLAQRFLDRNANVVVVGQGYVGLPLALEFATTGFAVTGLENDLGRVAALNLGESYIPDVESAMLRQALTRGRYVASADPSVLADADAIIICVPTPLRKSKDPDISYIGAAAELIGRHLRREQLIVLESTTYPGTTEELLQPLFESKGFRVGVDLHLAFSPERIDPGSKRFSVRDIPKLVGGVTAACGRIAALLYRQIIRDVIELSSPKVAELAKLYENLFRNVNIALANEFALMCRRLGVSVREVIDAAASKPFGFLPFYPGPGIGGHCIGVDPSYLAWKMRSNGYESRFIALADEINRAMPEYAVELVVEALNQRKLCVNGTRILVLGVAYKRGVGDTRESPALEVIAALRRRGAAVKYADPYVPMIALDGDEPMKAVDASAVELGAADCVLILTDHAEFDYTRVVTSASLVVDTRNATYGIEAPPGRVVRL